MKTKPLPHQPFLTADFSDRGGGIDFLGLRLVNMRMIAQNLLPGVNNTTTDIGMFCLGAWIPWKFQRVCEAHPEKFTEENYERFRQAIEVLMAEGVKDGSEANNLFGHPNRRIGVGQEIVVPGELAFGKQFKRTEATSVYAAALYGPALRYLGFVGYATAEDGKSTWIHLPINNENTERICRFVEDRIGNHPLIERIADLDFHAMSSDELVSLQVQGLHPKAFQEVPESVTRALVERILGPSENEVANPRHLSTQLIVDILRNFDDGASSEKIREIWYTGLLGTGEPLKLSNPRLEKQRIDWAIFEARQYQRYILETFLRCFEAAVAEGRSSISEIIDHTMAWLQNPSDSLSALVERECQLAGAPASLEKASPWWNEHIASDSESYEWLEHGDLKGEPDRALLMLARWTLRTRSWIERYRDHNELSWGEESRMSLRWFHRWLSERMGLPLRDFLKDLYANLVFTQHLRVALSRLNPGDPMQRLRFVLGDFGIVPTPGMQNKLGRYEAPWMGDRLDAWLLLLADVGIVSNDENKLFSLGDNWRWVEL